MKNIYLPYFGEIAAEIRTELSNIGEQEDFAYDVDTTVNNQAISIDINAEEQPVTIEDLLKIKQFLEKLSEYDNLIKTHFINDFYQNKESDIRFYLTHHLEEFDKEDLSELIDFENNTISPIEQLLAKMNLVRVGIYPHEMENFTTFDYSIGEDFTNYLLVIYTNKNGDITGMTMES